MPTGVGTALLISAAIGAGTSAVEAGIQSKQTSKAVKAQENAANQAQANLKPFQDTGTQAFQTLGGLMGLGGGGGGAVQTPQLSGKPTGVVTGPSASYMKMSDMGAISDPSKNGGYAGQAPGTATLGSASSYANPSAPGYAPHSSPVPNVKMQAPDGSVQDIPADQVGHYTQLGAKVVG